jgi:alanine-glyoxylate transaminase / serine-glyoxylate transaminase / serine-pyruvate transaminase
MTVRAGREFLAIPGPTTMPDEVLAAMHRPAIDIYTGPLVAITDSILADVGKLMRSQRRPYIYIANGHGAWEATLTNVLSKGDRVLVLESGRFAAGWGTMAGGLGCPVETLPGAWQSAVDPAAVRARLEADMQSNGCGRRIKAVLVVQVDTASGVVNDIPAIGAAIRASGHDALYMVDAVASLGCMPFDMDGWGIDVAMSACQKGLMSPPGLSFVAANARAIERHQHAGLRTPYWDWTAREGEEHYRKYAGTPPEHLLFALRKALDMIHAEGEAAIFERHRILAGAVHRAVATWAQGGAIGFSIAAPAERSNTVTAIRLDGEGRANALIDYCNTKCGVVLGRALGDLAGCGFRIAHMGHVNAPMVLGTLAVVETGLAALAIPHGKGGIGAAIDWLAQEVKPEVSP